LGRRIGQRLDAVRHGPRNNGLSGREENRRAGIRESATHEKRAARLPERPFPVIPYASLRLQRRGFLDPSLELPLSLGSVAWPLLGLINATGTSCVGGVERKFGGDAGASIYGQMLTAAPPVRAPAARPRRPPLIHSFSAKPCEYRVTCPDFRGLPTPAQISASPLRRNRKTETFRSGLGSASLALHEHGQPGRHLVHHP
jgi:hypothetical protein